MGVLSSEDIDHILSLVDKSRFDVLRLEIGDTKLELHRRGAASSPAVEVSPARAASPAIAPAAAPAPAAAAPAPLPSDGKAVSAPLLGTFYLSPKPGEPPFVEVGQRVTAETVIGIIEVMKLMNSVTAGLAGTVVAIHAENGALVEHGQALITVKPD